MFQLRIKNQENREMQPLGTNLQEVNRGLDARKIDK